MVNKGQATPQEDDSHANMLYTCALPVTKGIVAFNNLAFFLRPRYAKATHVQAMVGWDATGVVRMAFVGTRSSRRS
jgi:hypothetical protein